MPQKVSIRQIGDVHQPSLAPHQCEELAKNGCIRTVTGRGGDRWESIWRLHNTIYLGWQEITRLSAASLHISFLRIFYAGSGVAVPGIIATFWNLVNVLINAIDLVVGYWNKKDVNVHYSILSELWNGLQARQVQDLRVEPKWNTAYWSPTHLPLPISIISFLQLYSGSSKLHRLIVEAMLLVPMENSGSASIFSQHVIDALRATNNCTEEELYEARNFAEVSYLWTLIANPLAESTVEQNIPIDKDMPAVEQAELLAKRRATLPNIRLEALLTLLTDSIYTDNIGMQRVIMLINGTLNAEHVRAPVEFYAGELRTFDDNYRFVWGLNGITSDGKPLIFSEADDSDVINLSDAIVYERNYIPLIVNMVLGWRIIVVPLRTIATIWNMATNLFSHSWFGAWSIRRLSSGKDYEGQRKFIYSENGSSISRPRYNTIRSDYEQYLMRIEEERKLLIDNGNSYIGNRILLTVLSYLITSGKLVYGTSNYLVLQPILIIIYNIVLFYLVILVGIFVPLCSILVAWFNTCIYDLDGRQGLFPPARIVVLELVFSTMVLILVSTLRTIWYALTGVVMVIVALVTDAFFRVYNLFVVNTLGFHTTEFKAVVTALKNPNPSRDISSDSAVWYQPPQSWISKRLHLATARYLYLTYSSMSDSPMRLGHIQAIAVDMLISGNIVPKLKWTVANSKDYVRETVAKRDAELIYEFANLETAIIAEMPPMSTTKIRLNSAHWDGSIGLIHQLGCRYEALTGRKPELGKLIYNVLQNMSSTATVENKDEPYYEYTDDNDPNYTLPIAHKIAKFALSEHIRLLNLSVPIQPAQIY
jgi:hypothetical protein